MPAAIALDPIDGTTLTAKGLPGAISVLAVAFSDKSDEDPRHLFPAIPSHYMQKIAVGPGVTASNVQLDLDAPLDITLQRIAGALEKRVVDLVAVVLDRPRHLPLINTLRELGSGIRLISDGDVAGAIAPSLPNSGVDVYLGIGGSPEAVISGAAIKGLGGSQFCRIWIQDDAELNRLQIESSCLDDDLCKVWTVDDIAVGENIVFVATGISDSPMLRGIRAQGHHFITHSVLIETRNEAMRFVETYHDIAHKRIRTQPCESRVVGSEMVTTA